MNGMPVMGPWMMLLWGLFTVALLVLVVLAVIWLVRSLLAGPGGSRDDRDGTEEILRRRYAAGEISHEEYMRLREDLNVH